MPGWGALGDARQRVLPERWERMVELTSGSVVVATRDHLSAELGGEAVILDLSGGSYYGLNEVGAHIWGLLSTPTRVEEICTRVEEEFEVDPDRCREAVLQLLREMVGAGLIEVA
jgi:hypothetical protein